MGFIARTFVALASASFLLPSIADLNLRFPYGSKKVRGVNLGGWLVLEPWITPSLFDNTNNPNIVDEWSFAQLQDRKTATKILQRHWNTWITKSDFAAIAAAGLNHVRVPIGYWAFDVSAGEPYIQGQLPYLINAVKWAQAYGLKFIVDLHGVPGSQNGYDNSGQRMFSPQWQTNGDNIKRSNAIIKRLASMFADNTGAVSIIAPLNEPAGYFGDDVLGATVQYWHDSYGNIRFPSGTSQISNIVVMIHDSFQPLSYWDGFMSPPQWQGVILDTHIYQIFFNGANQMSYAEHISLACSTGSLLQSSSLWVLVGEWTPASNDCAKYLNGRGVGSRYEGKYPGSTFVGSCNGLTGKASSFSTTYKTFLRQFWEAQAMSYEHGGEGWIQWTWKAEEADEWSYQAGLANGWIPQNPKDLQFPNICKSGSKR